MAQSYGLPGRTRDSKDDLIALVTWARRNDCPLCDDDVNTICRHEIGGVDAALTTHGRHVDQQVDALHAVTSILKIGETKKTRQEVRDYCRLHNEPLPFPDMQKRPSRSNDPDAA